MTPRGVALFLFFFVTAGSATVGLRAEVELSRQAAAEAPIERFVRVDTGLYRGAQPTREGFEFLRALGIRTVVSFREEADEKALVQSLGMIFVHIPVTFRVFGGTMPEEAVTRFFDVVDNRANDPIFVHCRRGADRTGAFIGLYRMVRQGWNLERAYSEARDTGMRWWYPAVKGQLATFARVLGPASVGATD